MLHHSSPSLEGFSVTHTPYLLSLCRWVDHHVFSTCSALSFLPPHLRARGDLATMRQLRREAVSLRVQPPDDPRPHPRPSVRSSPRLLSRLERRPLTAFGSCSCRNYVSQATALKKNITFAKGDTLILRADHKTKLSANGPGRDSFRLMSKKTYTNHVSVYVPDPCACCVDMLD